MKPIPYGRQFISDDDIKAVIEVLRSDFLTQGPEIKKFEDAFASSIGCKYCVAVANGTAALHLCAMALGVNSNTLVITSPITFAASANCIRYCGGNIDFSDIDSKTYLLDLDLLEKKLKESDKNKYQGVVVVDLAGFPVNLERLREIADDYNLWIIEDACHAPGGYFTDSKKQKQRCGNGLFADLSVFSFHPVKHIACGEGGMITTNDKKLYDQLILLRTHGITKDPALMKENHGGWYYEMVDLGYNYRLTDFQAALGTSQLKGLYQSVNRRKEIANKYVDSLRHLPLQLPYVPENCSHAYHLFIIQTERRKELYDFLKSKNIFSQVHYIPVHLLPYYAQFGFKEGMFPNAESYYKKCLSLPMYPTLTDEEQDYVISCIKQFYKV